MGFPKKNDKVVKGGGENGGHMEKSQFTLVLFDFTDAHLHDIDRTLAVGVVWRKRVQREPRYKRTLVFSDCAAKKKRVLRLLVLVGKGVALRLAATTHPLRRS